MKLIVGIAIGVLIGIIGAGWFIVVLLNAITALVTAAS